MLFYKITSLVILGFLLFACTGDAELKDDDNKKESNIKFNNEDRYKKTGV